MIKVKEWLEIKYNVYKHEPVKLIDISKGSMSVEKDENGNTFVKYTTATDSEFSKLVLKFKKNNS
jgi:hypothetical protein